jgi:NDP-sugar pyrophosphorylase family protein
MALITDVLIMAAGRGNRMKPLSDIIPKAMAPYKGTTLIGNVLKNFQNGEQKIHVTVGYKSEILAKYLLEGGLVSSLINTAGQNNAWWIFNSLLSYKDGPVLVLTCDNITELDLDFISSEYVRLGNPACMIVPVDPIIGIEGDSILDQDGVVYKLSREIKTNKYCSGIQVLNPNKINSLIGKCDDFYQVWNGLMEQSQLSSSELYPNPWFSVDTLDQLISQENI